MSLDTFVPIVCAIALVVCWVGYRHLSENVRLTYKDQRIPQDKKGAKK